MNTLFKIFYNPVGAFRGLSEEKKFPLMSLVLLLVVVIINNILMIPVTAKVGELTFSSMKIQVSDDQLEYATQFLYKMRYLQVVGAVFSYVFMLVLYTLVVWILTKIAKQTLSFQKAFELMIHCCFALAIGTLVNTFILYGRGIENIGNMYEISLTGLNLLTSTESVGVTFYTFLSLITPFYFWFVALMTIGLAVLAGMKYLKAFIISIIFYMIIIAYTVITIYFSQVLLHSKGLI
jgi:hypothetical protein